MTETELELEETYHACIRAGQFQQRLHITEVVIYLTGATEGLEDGEKKLTCRVYKYPSTAGNDDGITPLSTHANGVVQGLTDGHLTVIGHSSEIKHLNASKEIHGKELCHAVTIGNGPDY